ncbi:MAG: transcription factor [Chloroflexi bacterium]|nr:transcription factor [Chloroflexota bacterium]
MSRIGVEGLEESRLEREERGRGVEALASELLAIGRRCASRLREGPSAVEHGDFLYDEHGLPK